MPNFRLLTQLGEKLISVWALVGGLFLLSVVILNIGSIIGSIVLIHVPGDFELTQIGVAVAIFCFLPYCQLHRYNVSADISRFGQITIPFYYFELVVQALPCCFQFYFYGA